MFTPNQIIAVVIEGIVFNVEAVPWKKPDKYGNPRFDGQIKADSESLKKLMAADLRARAVQYLQSQGLLEPSEGDILAVEAKMVKGEISFIGTTGISGHVEGDTNQKVYLNRFHSRISPRVTFQLLPKEVEVVA